MKCWHVSMLLLLLWLKHTWVVSVVYGFAMLLSTWYSRQILATSSIRAVIALNSLFASPSVPLNCSCDVIRPWQNERFVRFQNTMNKANEKSFCDLIRTLVISLSSICKDNATHFYDELNTVKTHRLIKNDVHVSNTQWIAKNAQADLFIKIIQKLPEFHSLCARWTYQPGLPWRLPSNC